MGDIGAEPDHRHVHPLEEEQVTGQLVRRLEREAHHHAGSGLIAGPFQNFQAVEPSAEIVRRISRMDSVIEFLVGRFDPQQVPVRAGLEPAAVGFFGLLSERQGDSQAAVVDFLDLPDETPDPRDEFRVTALPALQGHGTISQFVGQAGAGKHFLVAETITFHPPVPASQAAVQAVFLADIAELDETPQMHVIVQMRQFDLQPAPEKPILLRAFRRKEHFDFLSVKVLLVKQLFKCGIRGHTVSHSISMSQAGRHTRASRMTRGTAGKRFCMYASMMG